MTKQLEVAESTTITVNVTPPGAHIAQYRWSENSGGEIINLTPHDDATAYVQGIAAGQARVTLDTINADGTPGPSYSEDVDVTEAPGTIVTAETGDTTVKADSVSFEWSDGAEVAPTLSDPIAPEAWTAPELQQPAAEENSYGA